MLPLAWLKDINSLLRLYGRRNKTLVQRTGDLKKMLDM